MESGKAKTGRNMSHRRKRVGAVAPVFISCSLALGLVIGEDGKSRHIEQRQYQEFPALTYTINNSTTSATILGTMESWNPNFGGHDGLFR
jgi:hypothetical protein